jgi:hypothetical protein
MGAVQECDASKVANRFPCLAQKIISIRQKKSLLMNRRETTKNN